MPMFLGPHEKQPYLRLIYADLMALILLGMAALGYFVHWEVPFCLAIGWYVLAILERYVVWR